MPFHSYASYARLFYASSIGCTKNKNQTKRLLLQNLTRQLLQYAQIRCIAHGMYLHNTYTSQRACTPTHTHAHWISLYCLFPSPFSREGAVSTLQIAFRGLRKYPVMSFTRDDFIMHFCYLFFISTISSGVKPGYRSRCANTAIVEESRVLDRWYGRWSIQHHRVCMLIR